MSSLDLRGRSTSCFGRVNQEVVGTRAPPTRSLFGGDILRSLLPRVSLAKPTSAPLQYLWLRGTKPRFWFPQHPSLRETRRAADTIQRTTSALQIFQPVLLPLLLPQELQRYDSQQ